MNVEEVVQPILYALKSYLPEDIYIKNLDIKIYNFDKIVQVTYLIN